MRKAAKDVSVPPMAAIHVLQALLALFTAFWALYVVAMPLIASLRRSSARGATQQVHPQVVVIVPAHNMAAEIEHCVAAIRACAYPQDRVSLRVVADHCTDDTAERATRAGAEVLVRSEEPPGKTYAIAWTLRQIRHAGGDPDLFVITDGTARLDSGFLAALVPKWRAGEDIIVGHSIVSSSNMKWFARCLGLTLVHRNLQNWARERLALSSLIEGRGMAYSRRYVQRFGWSLALPTHVTPGAHPTEDWRHGVRAVEHGVRVAFENEARVFTPLRGDIGAATRQGIRWERGRQLNAMTHGLRILGDAVRKRDRLAFFAALDSIQLPVAVLGVLCAALAILTWAMPDTTALKAAGYAPAILMIVYGLQVTLRGRADGISPATLAWAPIYLLWRLSAFVLAWAPAGRSGPARGKPAP